MELALQLASNLKNVGACISLIRVWWFKTALYMISKKPSNYRIFPKSTYYSVNKRREHLSTEGVFVKQH